MDYSSHSVSATLRTPAASLLLSSGTGEGSYAATRSCADHQPGSASPRRVRSGEIADVTARARTVRPTAFGFERICYAGCTRICYAVAPKTEYLGHHSDYLQAPIGPLTLPQRTWNTTDPSPCAAPVTKVATGPRPGGGVSAKS